MPYRRLGNFHFCLSLGWQKLDVRKFLAHYTYNVNSWSGGARKSQIAKINYKSRRKFLDSSAAGQQQCLLQQTIGSGLMPPHYLRVIMAT